MEFCTRLWYRKKKKHLFRSIMISRVQNKVIQQLIESLGICFIHLNVWNACCVCTLRNTSKRTSKRFLTRNSGDTSRATTSISRLSRLTSYFLFFCFSFFFLTLSWDSLIERKYRYIFSIPPVFSCKDRKMNRSKINDRFNFPENPWDYITLFKKLV